MDHIIYTLGGTLCLCASLDIFLIYLYYKKKACLKCQGNCSEHKAVIERVYVMCNVCITKNNLHALLLGQSSKHVQAIAHMTREASDQVNKPLLVFC